jgi:hypothetical protein
MKSIEISNKTHLIKVWHLKWYVLPYFKWYRVQRGGTDWQPLKIEKRQQPFSIDRTAKNLAGKGSVKPPIDLTE